MDLLEQKKKFPEKTLIKNIHKIYLTLALLLGALLAIGMPFFNEPDGQYHYIVSSQIAGLTTNLSHYGEQTIGTGVDGQVPFYQDNTRFEEYYLQKIEVMPNSKLPRATELPSVFSYNYVGHLIPAIGVWLGYHVYPSLGVMITVARLFSVFVCSIAMFFIIKRVKKGKLLFAAVMLSPVAMNSFASLSYDAINFVWVAMLAAVAINFILDEKIKIWRILQILIMSGLTVIWAKTNFIIVIPVFLLIFIGKLVGSKKERKSRIYGHTLALQRTFKSKYRPEKNRLLLFIFVFLAVIAAVAALIILGARYGGGLKVISLFLTTFTYRHNGISVAVISQSLLAQPYPEINFVPLWLSAVWLVLIVIVTLSEEKYVESKFISYGTLVLFILAVIAVYYGFLSTAAGNGYISGVQGRYFTPLLLLFSIISGHKSFKLKLHSYKTVVIALIVIAVGSNVLLLVDTLQAIL